MSRISGRLLVTGLAVVALAGCGQGGGGGASPTPSSSSATAVPSPSTTGASDGTASGSSGGQKVGVTHCTVATGLKVAIASGEGGAAGHVIVNLRFINRGSRSCYLYGSPGVSFVAGDNGAQVGRAATRQPRAAGRKVTIPPGGYAYSPLRITSNGPLEPCKPVPVRGLRVYPPDDTGAAFVAMPQQACSAAAESQLDVQTVR